MDLKSGCIFWPEIDGPAPDYPKLDRDRHCDVAVIGGGITGAMSADQLAGAGARVILVDRREICRGSTPASTGLLQYEIDTPLTRLIERFGQDPAERAYRISHRSLRQLRELVAGLDDDCGLTERPSLYLGCEPDDATGLRAEQVARCKIGIDVECLSATDLRRDFGINRPAALWSREAMEVDPYRLTLSLLRRASASGAEIYAESEVSHYEPDGAGVTLRILHGPRIRCRRVIFATGYETPEFLDQRICSLKSTYALASEPVPDLSPWPRRCLIWESGKPYFYARTTADNRVMVGGEDEDFSDPQKRDALIERKSRLLARKFRTLLADIPITPACCWAGTFAETNDGLPYIGANPQFPCGYFALGYGGNGITFSLVAVHIIRDLFLGKENDDAELFRFDR